MTGTPVVDPTEEGTRIVDESQRMGVTLRLLGGVAISLTSPSSHQAPLARGYGDVDVVGAASERQQVVAALAALGYFPNEQLNILHGRRRLYFWDEGNGRQVDVFLDEFEMCHRLEFASQLHLASPTLPLADLLLTKLQIVETTEKDFIDILALLVDHPFDKGPGNGIDLSRICALCGDDWGLWRTVRDVAEKARGFAHGLGPLPGTYVVDAQVATLSAALDDAPKTRRWRRRSWVGERVRWYELPEETVDEMGEMR